MYAAGNGHLEVVKALIQAGADVNLPNEVSQRDRYLNLHVSIPLAVYMQPVCLQRRGFAQCIRIYSINYVLNFFLDQYAHTALMCAAQQGHLEVVKALLQAGADVNLQDNVSYARDYCYA